MKTTGERPHLPFREGFQNAAYLQTVVCGLSWPIGNQIHIPLLRPQQATKALCSLSFRLQAGEPAHVEPGHNSLPKRAHPARQAHQPLGPGTASRPQAGLSIPTQTPGCGPDDGGVDTGLPAVPAPSKSKRPRAPSQPTAGIPSSRQADLRSSGGRSTAKQAHGNRARPGPVLNAFAESEAQPHLSRPQARRLAISQPIQHCTPSPTSPQTRHPW